MSCLRGEVETFVHGIIIYLLSPSYLPPSPLPTSLPLSPSLPPSLPLLPPYLPPSLPLLPPYLPPPPSTARVGKALFQMLVIQAFRADRLMAMASIFVSTVMGEAFMHDAEQELDLASIVSNEVNWYGVLGGGDWALCNRPCMIWGYCISIGLAWSMYWCVVGIHYLQSYLVDGGSC